ncbi:MAG: hypothetical protein DWQ09_07300 [Proteobacteria bacterium]|nr:MAG: hypothetical protein DWQ09_07300 [Pseudomonadota bacterium]QKK12331.1 MAG: hypothetical protein HND59_12840 [Pseudomonadota bacterium]
MEKSYQTFVRDPAHLLSGHEVVLSLRDLTPGRKKYRGLNVRAKVVRPPHSGEPLLWIYSVVGEKDPEPCSIEIVEVLPDLIEGAPYTDFFKALARLERKSESRSENTAK